LKQIKEHGLIPETYEQELGRAMQKIISLENELELQHNYMNDTKELYENKLKILENDKEEIFQRELNAIKKINEMNKKLSFYDNEQKEIESTKEVSKEMFLKSKKIYESKIEELRKENQDLREKLLLLNNRVSDGFNDKWIEDEKLNSFLNFNFRNVKNFNNNNNNIKELANQTMYNKE